MKRSEALALENKMQDLLREATKENIEISLALTGRIRIQWDETTITFNKGDLSVNWVSYTGYYGTLVEAIESAQRVFSENRKDFDLLVWSYENIRTLEDG